MRENDALQIQLRKNQDTLKIVGLGVMAFGIMKTMYFFMTAVVLAVEIAIRLYIGRSAVAEGKGERKGPGYIVVAFLITLIGLALTFTAIVVPGIRIELNLEALMSLFVEITSAVITLEMCWSAVRVRKLLRQLAEQE